MLLGNYFHAKFQGILMSGSLENSSFPRKQPVTIFWSNAHAWFYLGFMAKMKSMRKVLVNVFFARKEKKKSPEMGNLQVILI